MDEIAEQDETKECPKCAETIKSRATVCRFCQYDFSAPRVEVLPGEVKCVQCNFVGKPKTYTPGNFMIELILWFFFLLPGLIYSCWRVSGRYKGCGNCRSRALQHF